MGGDGHNQPVPVGHHHSDPIPAQVCPSSLLLKSSLFGSPQARVQDSRNGPASGIRVIEKEFRQDGPPKGGYKPINYKGIFPNRGTVSTHSTRSPFPAYSVCSGPGPMAVLGVGLAVMTYGFVQIVRGNRKTR